jgi:hypothetical protein
MKELKISVDLDESQFKLLYRILKQISRNDYDEDSEINNPFLFYNITLTFNPNELEEIDGIKRLMDKLI